MLRCVLVKAGTLVIKTSCTHFEIAKVLKIVILTLINNSLIFHNQKKKKKKKKISFNCMTSKNILQYFNPFHTSYSHCFSFCLIEF